MKIDFTTETKKFIAWGLTLGLIVAIGQLYLELEKMIHSDVGCGCSSACRAYFPNLTSRVIGYFMLLGSLLLFLAGIAKFRSISRWWTLPAILIFVVALYGNGYMIFNKGACGNSLNITTWFVVQTKLGDFAKTDGESLDFDRLQRGKLKGKLLGFSLDDKNLIVFRIGDEPLTLKTNFLFWQIERNVLVNDLLYGLDTYRNIDAETGQGVYEFIGGQGMSERDFLNEIMLKKEFPSDLKNTRVLHKDDGTTRFFFEWRQGSNN